MTSTTDTSTTNQPKSLSTVRNLSTDAIIRCLEQWAGYLSSIEQLQSSSMMADITDPLVEKWLIQHKNKEVRLLTSCCLSDILRISAPDAPYESQVLTKVFNLFIEQLRYLDTDKTDTPIFQRCFYLLESLALVKSFILALEHGLDDCVLHLFQTFFSIIRDDHSHKVFAFVVQILCTLLEEAGEISQELLDVVLSPLLESDASCLASGGMRSRTLARTLVERCVDVLNPAISLFFKNAFHIDGNDFEETDTSELASSVYALMFELNVLAPSTLLYALPLLVEQLEVEVEFRRLAAAKLFVRIFTETGSTIVNTNMQLWAAFRKRFSDASPTMRNVCVTMCKTMLLAHPEVQVDIWDALKARIMDPDDSVRLSVIYTVTSVASEHLESVNDELLDLVVGRLQDKKPSVRKEALLSLAGLYQRINFGINPSSKSDRERLSSVPGAVLGLYATVCQLNDMESTTLIEGVFCESILPCDAVAIDRVRHLLDIYNRLDATCRIALGKIFVNKAAVHEIIEKYLATFCNIQNKGRRNQAVKASQKDADASLDQLARLLPPDENRARERLQKMHTSLSKDSALLKLLTKVSNIRGEARGSLEAGERFVAKIKTAAGTNVGHLAQSLVHRLLMPIAGQKGVMELITLVRKQKYKNINVYESTDLDKLPSSLLQRLCGTFPVTFCSDNIQKELVAMASISSPLVLRLCAFRVWATIGSFILKDGCNVIGAVELLQDKLCRLCDDIDLTYEDQCISSDDEEEHSHKISAIEAKLAMRALVALAPTVRFDNLMKSLVNTLKDAETNELLLPALAALGEIGKTMPVAFEPFANRIVNEFILDELFGTEDVTPTCSKNPNWTQNPNWRCTLQLAGIKVMTRRLIGVATNSTTLDLGRQAAQTARRTFASLLSCIRDDGHVATDASARTSSAATCSRLRLAAACALVRLARYPCYQQMLVPKVFQRIVMVIQDSCCQVRCAFIKKIGIGLRTLKLPLQFLAALALVVVDNDRDNVELARRYFIAAVQQRRHYMQGHPEIKNNEKILQKLLPEYGLPYLVYLIARHPEFIDYRDVNVLHRAQHYLNFFLGLILKGADNYNFLHHVFQAIRARRDATVTTFSTSTNGWDVASVRAHVLCDLGALLLQQQSDRHNWILKPFPGAVLIPSQLYVKPDKEFNISHSFLPPDFVSISASSTNTSVSGPLNTTSSDVGTSSKRKSIIDSPTPSSAKKRVKPSPKRIQQPTKSPSRINSSRAAKNRIGSMRDPKDSDEDSYEFRTDDNDFDQVKNGKKSLKNRHHSFSEDEISSMDEGELSNRTSTTIPTTNHLSPSAKVPSSPLRTLNFAKVIKKKPSVDKRNNVSSKKGSKTLSSKSNSKASKKSTTSSANKTTTDEDKNAKKKPFSWGVLPERKHSSYSDCDINHVSDHSSDDEQTTLKPPVKRMSSRRVSIRRR